MARRAAKIKEIREEGPPVLLIEGGELSPEYSRQGEIKFETVLESLRKMRYDALNIGRCEMLMQRPPYDAVKKVQSIGLPIVT
ncbi:MAG: hypothetical protein JW821_17140, partial [Deltaproteobacteria bacterium]|nr:hypothetical protein [Deltaproteobacteria bacterium]